MPVSIHSRLGRYEVLARIGAGGMGEVYRARDSKLGRDVAIKVLPEGFARDSERMARFEREAKLLAILNHPHIAAIYGVEESGSTDALVMELAEGQTLAERIASSPIPVSEAIAIARQIADGLEYAHERGIVHRDLKPANIKISRDDAVKILDFGLAKAVQGEAEVTDPANSPTMTEMGTQAGVLLGTAAYMAPEQAKGKPVDRRADIWAFGCVLYEMLTGKKAFQAETVSETLAAVLQNEPDWSQLPDTTPVRIRILLDRCLRKDAKRRLRDIGDARISLDELLFGAEEPAAPPDAKPSLWRRALPWALLAGTAALAGFFYWNNRPPAAEPVRFELPLASLNASFTLSPNGRQLAYLAPNSDGRSVIWIRSLDSIEPHWLRGSEDIIAPVFWSADSRFVAFQTNAQLKKIDVSGGPPQPICDMPDTVLGGAWNQDGIIIFGTIVNGVMKVSAGGGTPSSVTSVKGRNEVHVFPSFLPDGKHFIYLKAPENAGIYIGSLDAKADQQSSRRLLATPVLAVYAPPSQAGIGHLLFVREGSLLAQPLDDRRLALTGDPVVIVPRVATFLLSGSFSASSNGVLAYRGSESAPDVSLLTWFDRKGKELGAAGERGNYEYFDLRLSPDAERVATSRTSLDSPGGEVGIWLVDLLRGVSARFTLDSGSDGSPVWSPDGRRIAFVSARAGGWGVYQKASDGASGEQPLIPPTVDFKVADDWSRDGRFLLYAMEDPATKSDLWALPLASDGTPGGAPIAFAKTEFNEGLGQFSPDAHWIAYASDESGRFEIYVRPFPAPPGGGSKTQISRGGGTQPRWRGDGRELFYLSPDGNAMAVNVTLGPAIRAGLPESLFQAPIDRRGRQGLLDAFVWDVPSDGRRFLINTAKSASRPVTVVLNWDSALKRK